MPAYAGMRICSKLVVTQGEETPNSVPAITRGWEGVRQNHIETMGRSADQNIPLGKIWMQWSGGHSVANAARRER